MEESFPLTVVFKKQDGSLVADSKLGIMKLDTFLEQLKEGDKVEVTYEVLHSKVSYSQLSLLHKCIRIIAGHTGHNFDEIKEIVKMRAGLYSEKGKFKSFADLSKDEISLAINAVFELGQELGLSL
jgi:hypothetical protein